MSAPAPHAPARSSGWSADKATSVALIGGVGLATVVAVAAGQGNPILPVLPAALVAGAYLVTRLPLRLSAAALLFLLLAPDMNIETQHQWRSPFAFIGDLLHDRLDGAPGIPGVPLTGMELAVVFLFGVYVWRKVTRQRLDGDMQAEPASILREILYLYLAAVVFSEVVGLARGLGPVPWKLRNLLHPIMLGLFFLAVFRPRDGVLIGKIIVAAAMVRSVFVIIVQRIAVAETGGRYESGTGHGDSVLFAVAAHLIIASVLLRPDWKRIRGMLLTLPLILLACDLNERRLVWVMLGMMMVFTYAVSPMTGWKRKLTRAGLLALPVLVAYVVVGWNGTARIFGPVQTLRSVADTSHDHSAYWREVEIWNIATTIRDHPILGMGLGGEYTESMENDDISSIYKEYREWPHNTVLGLLMMMGIFAFTAMWVLLPVVIFLSMRVFRMAADPEARLVALGCMGAVTACLIMAWGDTGAHYPQHKVMMALAFAISARLAVLHGAWPARSRRYAAAISSPTKASSFPAAASQE